MENVTYMISRKYDTEYLRSGGDEAKIDVYGDRVEGWIINQAKFVAKNKDSGFAELLIILSFFESHAKYLPDSPTAGRGQSGNRFKHVIKKVFPELEDLDSASEALQALWKDGRCGLYHGGITGNRITISGKGHAIAVYKAEDGHVLDIDPGAFVRAVKDYFENYIRDLRNPKNHDLREHFFDRFG